MQYDPTHRQFPTETIDQLIAPPATPPTPPTTNSPPWKLLLHLALRAALTAQMLLLHHQDGGAYSRAMRRSFEAYFMPRGVDAGLPYMGGPRIVFENQAFLESLQASLHNYFRVNEFAAVSFAYRNDTTGALTLDPQPVRMRLTFAADYDGVAGARVRKEYWLAVRGDVGPFTGTAWTMD